MLNTRRPIFQLAAESITAIALYEFPLQLNDCYFCTTATHTHQYSTMRLSFALFKQAGQPGARQVVRKKPLVLGYNNTRTLPELLSMFPQDGHGLLVQPRSWQGRLTDCFFKITPSTKLEFMPKGSDSKVAAAAAAATTSSSPASAAAAKQVEEADEEPEEQQDDDLFGSGDDVVETETAKPAENVNKGKLDRSVKVTGKVYGIFFWKGEPFSPLIVHRLLCHTRKLTVFPLFLFLQTLLCANTSVRKSPNRRSPLRSQNTFEKAGSRRLKSSHGPLWTPRPCPKLPRLASLNSEYRHPASGNPRPTRNRPDRNERLNASISGK